MDWTVPNVTFMFREGDELTADCSCPIGQIKEGTEFLTEAGQGDPAACTQHPVAAPNPLD